MNETIKLKLRYLNENAVRSEKEMTIRMNLPKLEKRTAGFDSRVVYTMSFSMTIPDHIHAYLLGRTVPVSGMGKSNETKDYPQDYSKTIRRDTLLAVTDAWNTIIDDYQWLKTIDTAKLKKVIFYQFGTGSNTFRSDWNGIEFGSDRKLNFKYAIGYIAKNGESDQRYNFDKKLISRRHDNYLYGMKHVEWTEERQAFFDNIQKSFEILIERIRNFESSMNEETINSIISNTPSFLSLGQ